MARTSLIRAYKAACLAELNALKPGNVHRFADGHGMVVQQFERSAEVSAGPLTEPGWPVGQRVLGAIHATRAAVGINTNLGIVLLCAPILAAAQRWDGRDPADLQRLLAAVLAGLTMNDARDVFAAIAHAMPGGLGEAEHDVREPPRIGLLEAMGEAAGRDTIAAQYGNGFAGIFEVGLPVLHAERWRAGDGMWPCVATYLALMAAWPDSHVARKFGSEAALSVQAKAQRLSAKLTEEELEGRRFQLLLDFDAELKAQGINPGTSADLTVACLLVEELRDNLHLVGVDA